MPSVLQAASSQLAKPSTSIFGIIYSLILTPQPLEIDGQNPSHLAAPIDSAANAKGARRACNHWGSHIIRRRQSW